MKVLTMLILNIWFRRHTIFICRHVRIHKMSVILLLILLPWIEITTAQPPAIVCSFYPLQWSDMKTCGTHNAAFMGTTKLDLIYIDKYYGSKCNCWVIPLASRSLESHVPPPECLGDHDNVMYDIYKNTDVYTVGNSTCYTCKQSFSQQLTFPLLLVNAIRFCVLFVCVVLQVLVGEFSWSFLSTTVHVYVVAITLNDGTNQYRAVSTTGTPLPFKWRNRWVNAGWCVLKYTVLMGAVIFDVALVSMLLYVLVFAWVEPIHDLCGDMLLQYGTAYFYRGIIALVSLYILTISWLLCLRQRGVIENSKKTNFYWFLSMPSAKFDMINL
jgi:hypothetical protein